MSKPSARTFCTRFDLKVIVGYFSTLMKSSLLRWVSRRVLRVLMLLASMVISALVAAGVPGRVVDGARRRLEDAGDVGDHHVAGGEAGHRVGGIDGPGLGRRLRGDGQGQGDDEHADELLHEAPSVGWGCTWPDCLNWRPGASVPWRSRRPHRRQAGRSFSANTSRARYAIRPDQASVPTRRCGSEAALDGMTARVDDHGAMPRVRSPIRRGRWLLTGLVLLLVATRVVLAARGGAQEAPRPLLLLISIDGLRPDYVTAADSYQAKIPNLRRFLKDGAFADGVEGVIPTVTYPSHTTLITGVWPAAHGILANTTFDPRRENQGGWYWYTEDIRVPTLWDAARQAGMTTASIQWPVSVGARVTWNIPEFWRANAPDDAKLIRAVSTPGLLAELEPELGSYPRTLDIEADELRGRVRRADSRNEAARSAHVAPDRPRPRPARDGPGNARGHRRARAPRRGHRHAPRRGGARGPRPRRPRHRVRPRLRAHRCGAQSLPGVPRRAGLFSDDGKGRITDWKAMPWTAGGSVAIVLKDPSDVATRAEVRNLLAALAVEPGNGIDRVLEADVLHQRGGFPTASFLVGLKPGWRTGSSLTGPVRSAHQAERHARAFARSTRASCVVLSRWPRCARRALARHHRHARRRADPRAPPGPHLAHGRRQDPPPLMAGSTALRALILDYGNVLTHVQRDHWFDAMAAELGAPGDRFRDAYWGHRHAYDAGLSAHDYWRRVAKAVGRPVGDMPRPMIDRLIDMDVSSWAEYRDEVWDLARSFRAGGGRTAFLSNGVPETMTRLRAERALERWFDVVVVSYEVGLAKPDPTDLRAVPVSPGRARGRGAVRRRPGGERRGGRAAGHPDTPLHRRRCDSAAPGRGALPDRVATRRRRAQVSGSPRPDAGPP